MGRDFAKKGRHKNHRLDASQSSSHWVWLLAGVTIGVVISAIVFFKLMPVGLQQLTQATIEAPKTQEKEEKSVPHFDFYSLLPELEVTIPETKPKENTPTATAKAAEEAESKVTADGTQYRLQIASFREYKEADSLKAQLALLGMQVEIEAVNLGPNDTWYRVRSKQYPNQAAAQSAQAQLQTQSINSLLMEEQG